MTISPNTSSLLSLTSSAAKTSTAKTSASSANTASSGGYLDQLKSKFGNLNVTTGEYSGGPTGTGVQGNVLISPKLLAKAEKDPSVAEELESNLSAIPDGEEWLKNQCAAQGMNLDACGTIIDEDGNMSSWAQTSTAGAEDSDDEEEKKIEKKKKEEKTQESRLQEKRDEEEKVDAAAIERSSTYSEYEGAYGTLVSSSAIPYSLNVYA